MPAALVVEAGGRSGSALGTGSNILNEHRKNVNSKAGSQGFAYLSKLAV